MKILVSDPITQEGLHFLHSSGLEVDYIPDGLKLIGIDERCAYDKQFLKCQFGTFPAGYRETLKIEVIVSELYFSNGIKPKDSIPLVSGESENIFTNFKFSTENFK